MRQAGRYLPSYRKTRAQARDFLVLCKTPELACEVTLHPIDQLGVDAAILFSDILVVLEAMGMRLEFSEGEGPRLEPVRSAEAVAALRVPVAEESLGYVMDAIRLIVSAIDGRVPLIGFAGAPWTLLTYAVEGKTSKDFSKARRLLFEDPALAHVLLDKITEATLGYLVAQVRAGAQALQLFDSWAGALGPDEYRAFALPYVRRIVAGLRASGVGAEIPFIYFCNQGATLLADAATVGADVLGIDFRVPLDEARLRTGRPGLVLQGNLDPCALFAAPAAIEPRVADILRRGGERHIFNLGHGILPETPVEHVVALVETVHRLGRRGASGSRSHASAGPEGGE
jgi:uroporphyrinogen decarboxylase